MAIFNSYVSSPEGTVIWECDLNVIDKQVGDLEIGWISPHL